VNNTFLRGSHFDGNVARELLSKIFITLLLLIGSKNKLFKSGVEIGLKCAYKFSMMDYFTTRLQYVEERE
jgi:hypothetical protein